MGIVAWRQLLCLAAMACSSAPLAPSGGSAGNPGVRVPDPGAGAGGVAGGPHPAAGSGGTGSPLIVVEAAGRAAIGGAPAPADCGTLTQKAETKLRPADIVWIIDASPSMVDEIAAVQQNLSKFAASIASAGVDHHVVMMAPVDVAADTPLVAPSRSTCARRPVLL